MATGTADPTPVPPPVQTAALPHFEQYIEEQLNKTRSHVKWVDFFSSLLALAAGVLGFFLLTAFVDAWVFDLGTFGRIVALLALVGGSGWFVATRLMPLILRQINPAYAARVIEQAQPSLKNSIINFLLLRSNRTGVHELVYQAVEQQAASDLSHVPVDTAVDRSRLIKLGYVLAGVLCFAALYYVISPKSPFQTVARVLAPWAKKARPARVEIGEVTPGDAQVFHGHTQNISARISGARSGDYVVIIYNTLDGQHAQRAIPMHPTADGMGYEGLLSPGEGGIQQEIAYRVAIYDRRYGESELVAASPVAESDLFHLSVRPAPTITVQSVQYAYPAYTKRALPPPQKQGDIDALEGTKVTITATANLPIKSAYIEFDPIPPAAKGKPDKAGAASRRQAEVIPMQAEGQEARGTFVLELEADRATPKHSSYQLRFITAEGHQNDQPILHRISVTRDLPPEIEIVKPKDERIEVPEDGEQKIEIRAIDPDFSLSKISLRAVSGGADLLDQTLYSETGKKDSEAAKKDRGQAVVSFDFKPADLSLEAGQEVVYWAVAADNRTAPRSGTAEPNTERTRNYHIKITPAVKKPDPDKTKPAEGDKEPKTDEGAKKPDQEPKGTEEKKGGDKDNSKTGGSGGPSKTNPPQPGDKADKNPGDKADKNPGDKDSADKKPADKKPGDKGGEGEKQGGGEAGDKGDKPDKSVGKPGGKSGDEGGDAAADNKGGKAGDQKTNPGGDKADNPDRPDKKAGGQQGTGNGKQKPGDDPTKNPTSAKNDKNVGGQNAGDSGGKAGAGEQGENQGDKKPSGAGQEGGEPGGQQAEGGAADATGGKPGQDNRRTGGPGGKESQGGQQGEGSQAEERDGPLHDGEVIERLNELVKRQKEEKERQKQGQPADKGGQPGEKADSEAQPGAGKSGEKKVGEKQGGEKEPSGAAGQEPNADKKAGGASSEGGTPQGGEKTKPEGSAGGDKTGEKQADGAGKNGKSGAGKPSEGKSGSPESQGENQDKNKKPGDSAGGDKQGDESKSAAGSKKESNSKGGEAGEQDGGGKSGGGQGAQQPGNDSAGGSTPGDKGGGAAPQPGEGQTTNKGGKGPVADKPTGASGSEQGEGSKTQDGAGGKEPGAGAAGDKTKGEKSQGSKTPGDKAQGAKTPGDKNQGEGAGKKAEGDQAQGDKKQGAQPPADQGQSTGKGQQPQPGQNPNQDQKTDQPQPHEKQPAESADPAGVKPSDSSKAQREGERPGAGKSAGDPAGKSGESPSGSAGGNTSGPSSGRNEPGELPPEEKANLEFARKATDLALEHLRDQKDSPDPALLKKLGMSKAELARFLERWEGLKKGAVKDEVKGKRELDEALRSLGLRSNKDKLRSGPGLKDDNKGLLDQGPRSEPPPAYLEQFNAFKRGTARAEK